MALVLVTAPTSEPIMVGETKDFLRVTGSDEDVLISGLITAARQTVDGRDGWLNRALITQTWDLVLDAFPSTTLTPIEVPLPPLQSVTSITYVDGNGATQTWSSVNYLVDSKSQPGRITPAHGESYPATRRIVNAVTVRFVAGYGGAAAVARAMTLGL